MFKATKSDVPAKFVAVKVFRIQLNSMTAKDSLEHYESIARACRAMEREIEIHRGLKHVRKTPVAPPITGLAYHIPHPPSQSRLCYLFLPASVLSN